MKINTNNYQSFTWLVLILVALSAGVVYGITLILKKYSISVPWYAEAPSISGVYALLFVFFDRWLWKWAAFKKMGIIIADDLNGTWVGVSKTSYDHFASDITTELVITQTATTVKVHGKYNQSKSVSVHENFGISEVDNAVALFYFYRNEPSNSAVPTMAMHEGSTKLVYDKQTDSLEGYYFSGRDRNNHGTIKVFRQ